MNDTSVFHVLLHGAAWAMLAASCGGVEAATVLTCPADEMQCGAACVPADRDPKNCGACGITCASGEVCGDGACRTSCPDGEAVCKDGSGRFCTRLDSDDHNCGACGAACASGSVCIAGACTAACPAGSTPCGSACVDTDVDPANCGACGNQCLDHCANGGCVPAVEVAAGSATSCALMNDGDVVCWGSNEYGALGIGDPDPDDRSSTPVRVVANYGTKIVGSQETFCVTQQRPNWGGYMSCWGNNAYGQLGSQASGYSPLLQPINGGVSPLGTGYTTCATAWGDGTLWCWGYNFYGQVGDPTLKSNETDSPRHVQGPFFAASVAVGQEHVCAVTQQHAYCWGSNTYGQLGFGPFDSNAHPSPTLVAGLPPVRSVAAGVAFSCALSVDGTVDCWGTMQFDGGNATATPTAVPNLGNVATIAGGGAHACALIADGTVTCWGDNGGIGYDLSGLTDVIQIAAGGEHDCAVTKYGEVWCWGANPYGELGDGTNNTSAKPVKVK